MDVIAPDSWSTPLAGRGDVAVSAGPGPTGIGDLLEAGRGLTATCEVCLHSARLNLSDLAVRLGPDHPCDQTALRPMLQCSVCKSTEAVLQETRLTHRARPKVCIADYV